MNTLDKQTTTRLLFAIGIGVALTVSLNNIAIGIGVGSVFVFSILFHDKKNSQ